MEYEPAQETQTSINGEALMKKTKTLTAREKFALTPIPDSPQKKSKHYLVYTNFHLRNQIILVYTH